MRVRQRPGFTLVEALVSIGIVGLLLALIVPGVQHARSAARKTECQQHLHQFGTALASFAEVHRVFPTACVPESAYLRLLPYFEQSALLEAIRRSRTRPRRPEHEVTSWYVGAYGCPEDEVVQRLMEPAGDSSYYLNAGATFRINRQSGFRKSHQRDTRVHEIEDGLSHTVAMAERLVNEVFEKGEPPPGRDFWWTERRIIAEGEELAAIEQCLRHRTSTQPRYGYVRASGLSGYCDYDHILTPNQPSCHNGPEDFAIDSMHFLVPATSLHPGGVQALLADGSVHFVGDSIDGGVWRALGTRAGHEPAAIPQ